jgi:hypothetical protein
MGLIEFPLLCSFTLACILAVLGFIFTNFHFSPLFIIRLLVLR